MKLLTKIIIVCNALTCSMSCASTGTQTDEPVQKELTFIMAADWRHFATERYHSSEYFLGALEAIAEAGKGSFMVSPGDLDPVAASIDLITQVFGEDYPWYPVTGNHDIEDSTYMESLRAMNVGGNSLPNIVNVGPTGSVETTYSFDYEDCHFVVLNQYFDGESDMGTDGNIVPELLNWLEEDLKKNSKPYVFVLGHEPLIAMPDLANGRIRHVGDSLDQYPREAFKFHQLLLKYNVVAYLCGHTHNTSYSNINGLWQFDCGHARGTEDLFPGRVYTGITSINQENQKSGLPIDSAFAQFYRDNAYPTKKVMFYMDLTDSVSYKKLDDSTGFEIMKEFYHRADELGDRKQEYFQSYWNNWDLSRSTFMKFRITSSQLNVDIYRNDGFGGAYSIDRTITLDMANGRE